MDKKTLINGKEHSGVSTAAQRITEQGAKNLQKMKTMNIFFLIFVVGFLSILVEGFSKRVRDITKEKIGIVKEAVENREKTNQEIIEALDKKKIFIEAARTISKENLLIALCCVVFMGTSANVIGHLRAEWGSGDCEKVKTGHFILIPRPATVLSLISSYLCLTIEVKSVLFRVIGEKDDAYIVEDVFSGEIEEIKIFEIHTSYALMLVPSLQPIFVDNEDTIMEMFPSLPLIKKEGAA